jgi:hypothetical protein
MPVQQSFPEFFQDGPAFPNLSLGGSGKAQQDLATEIAGETGGGKPQHRADQGDYQ